MKIKTTLLCLLSTLALTASGVDARLFTTVDGKKVNGTLLEATGKFVKIKRQSDGRVFTVGLQRLSKENRKHVQAYLAKNGKKPKNVAPATKLPVAKKAAPAPKRKPAQSITATPRKDILTISRKIDQLLAKGYQKHGVKPLPKAGDATFLRRAYLDIAGRIPTYQETTAFLKDNRTDKRASLVDTLLDSEGFNSHSYVYWADILRIKDRLAGAGGNYGAPVAYLKWVKQAIRDNLPYNQFVYDMLTAEGYSWDNGAVGYYMRDSGMPLDNMSNTVQVFLGTQMVCAQCHNHPFDKWTQMDYYQLAAFTYGAHTRVNNPLRGQAQQLLRKEVMAKVDKKGGKPDKNQIRKYDNEIRRQYSRASGEIFKPVAYGVQDYHNRQLKLPHDYQYTDAKPEDKVAPGSIFGENVDLEAFEDRRDGYAKWMTSPENPRFTKVIANRLWKRAMGRGLYEPVDDLRDDSESANLELSKYLEQQMVALGYDMKQFLRAIYNTHAYGREGFSGEFSVLDKFPFQGPVVKRLSAEQIWDSYVTLSIPDADLRLASFKNADSKLDAYGRYEKILSSKTPAQVVEMFKKGAKLEAETNQQLRTLQEKILKAQQAEEFAAVSKLKREYGQMRRERENNYMMLATGGIDIMKTSGAMGKGMSFYNRMEPNRNESAHWKGFSRNLIRASELPNPAPAGHFLRQFGQSDRELIQNASEEASIPQVLTLLNGRHFNEILRPQSPLTLALREQETPEDKIRTIYLSILNRLPDADELAACMEIVSKHPELTKVNYDPRKQKSDSKSYLRAPWTDIVWAVLNTQEFLFRL